MPRLFRPPRLLLPVTAAASLALFAAVSPAAARSALHADTAEPTSMTAAAAGAPGRPPAARGFPGIPFEPREGGAPAGGAKQLPKGPFLDENGKPCSSCNSFSAWMKNGPPRANTSSTGGEASSSTSAAAAAAAVAASFGGERTEAEMREMRRDCPPDVEELGRATWTLLHTTASSLPASPTPLQQTHMANLLLALTHLYPCPHCRSDFASCVAKAGGEPAVREAVKTRAGVERWVWERHEEVNRKLGKEGGVPVDKVAERWRDGPPDGRCAMAW